MTLSCARSDAVCLDVFWLVHHGIWLAVSPIAKDFEVNGVLGGGHAPPPPPPPPPPPSWL